MFLKIYFKNIFSNFDFEILRENITPWCMLKYLLPKIDQAWIMRNKGNITRQNASKHVTDASMNSYLQENQVK